MRTPKKREAQKGRPPGRPPKDGREWAEPLYYRQSARSSFSSPYRSARGNDRSGPEPHPRNQGGRHSLGVGRQFHRRAGGRLDRRHSSVPRADSSIVHLDCRCRRIRFHRRNQFRRHSLGVGRQHSQPVGGQLDSDSKSPRADQSDSPGLPLPLARTSLWESSPTAASGRGATTQAANWG